MKLGIDCNEASKVCDKAQYKEASLWEKIAMKFHHIFCAFCRGHSAQNAKLTNAIKKANLKTMSLQQKEALKEKLENELAD